MSKKSVTTLVLDTTGLKAHGAGEWRSKRYGGKSKRKKLYAAIDLNIGKLILSEITFEHVHDTAHLKDALKLSNKRSGKVLIDGIGDSKKCYELCSRHSKQCLTHPKKGAVIRVEEGYEL